MAKTRNLARADELWAFVRAAFEPDGGLRDIIVLETDAADWDSALHALSAVGWPSKASIGDKPLQEPLSFDIMYGYRQADPVLLAIYADGIQMNSHFFESSIIEFDLDPREVNAKNFSTLCRFMATLSSATGKPCFLTAENMMAFRYGGEPILHVDASADQIVMT